MKVSWGYRRARGRPFQFKNHSSFLSLHQPFPMEEPLRTSPVSRSPLFFPWFISERLLCAQAAHRTKWPCSASPAAPSPPPTLIPAGFKEYFHMGLRESTKVLFTCMLAQDHADNLWSLTMIYNTISVQNRIFGSRQPF